MKSHLLGKFFLFTINIPTTTIKPNHFFYSTLFCSQPLAITNLVNFVMWDPKRIFKMMFMNDKCANNTRYPNVSCSLISLQTSFMTKGTLRALPLKW